nr:hypothetical protein [Tanacetum cinerariifolium]
MQKGFLDSGGRGDLWDALERQMRGSEYAEQDRKGAILQDNMSRDVVTVGSTMWIPLLYRVEKKEDKKTDEKKRDMSKVKCYNCKKKGHFAKDCKKAKVKDYNYYKTKMLLAKKDSDEQVLLAGDQAWMESSSDYDQEINANMVFMDQIEKVLSDSDESSLFAEETIAEQQGHLDLRFSSAERAFESAFNAANKGVWFVVQQPDEKGEADSDKLRHDQKCKKTKLTQDMQLIQKLRDDQKRMKNVFEVMSGSYEQKSNQDRVFESNKLSHSQESDLRECFRKYLKHPIMLQYSVELTIVPSVIFISLVPGSIGINVSLQSNIPASFRILLA